MATPPSRPTSSTFRLKKVVAPPAVGPDAEPEEMGRAINALTRAVTEAHDSTRDLVDQLNASATDGGTAITPASAWAGSLPIGIPLPWPKHLFPETFVLPDNVVYCDGRKINEPRSLLHGRTLEDLNSAGRFVRAAAPASSGTLQAHQVVTHGHAAGSLLAASHSHKLSAAAGTGALAVQAGGNGDVAAGGSTGGSGTLAVTGTAGDPSTANGAETRPVNIGLPFVMRIF